MYLLTLIAFFCLISTFSAEEVSSCSESPAYYWREYHGEIPCDALVAGADKDGKPVYIGQAIHNASYSPVLQPGQIHVDDSSLTYVWSGSAYEVKRFKILCSNNPSSLRWLPTNAKRISQDLPHKRFVVAGFDIQTNDEYPLLVGRDRKGDNTFVGKVTAYHQHAGMAYVEDKKVHSPSTFEVLYYDNVF